MANALQDEYNGITKRIGKHGWRWNKWYSEGKKKNGGDKAAMTNGEEAAEEETARILRNDMLIGGYILIVVGLGLATAVFAMEVRRFSNGQAHKLQPSSFVQLPSGAPSRGTGSP